MLLGGGLISLSKFNLGDECKKVLRSSRDELIGVVDQQLGIGEQLVNFLDRVIPTPEALV